MIFYKTIAFLSVFTLFSGCNTERSEEHVLDYHVNDIKKTSLWIFPSGEIKKKVIWFTNGIKKIEIPYKNNVPHGMFKEWSDRGDITATGYYKEGKKDGKWTRFYNKKTISVEYYKDDHPVGDWESWHHNSSHKAFESHYDKNGDAIGVWKAWHVNGYLALENTCHSSNPDGYEKHFSSDGIIAKDQKCKFGREHGLAHEYYPSGKLMIEEEYEDGNKKGKRSIFRADATPQKEEFWDNKLREGSWKWIDKDGNILKESLFKNGSGISYGTCHNGYTEYVCAESTFVEGKLSGTIWYTKPGRPFRYEETWDDGIILATRSFYPETLKTDTGDTITYTKPASEGFWKDGKREGIWRTWFENGQIKDSLTYKDGERFGEQFVFDSLERVVIHTTEAGRKRPVIMHIPTTKSDK